MGWYPHNNNQTPCLARLSTIRRPKFSRKPLSLLALKKAALVATTIVLVKDLYDTVDALRQAGLIGIAESTDTNARAGRALWPNTRPSRSIARGTPEWLHPPEPKGASDGRPLTGNIG